MSKAVAVILAVCALAGVAAAADRKLLQSNYLGYRTRFNVEAPQASRWGAGFSTGASGPATYNDRVAFTGPSPPSAAFGVNPTGGFAEWKDTARFDATLPRYSAVGRASQANTWAADLSAGTKIIPDIQESAKIRPSMPLTFPVFNFGGTALPTPTYQTVINPPRGVLGAPNPKPKGKDGGAKDGGAKEGGAKEGGGDDAKGGDDRRRRLLNWGREEILTARAPSTPRFTGYINPPPAVSDSSLAVVGDKVNLDAAAKIPGDLVKLRGATNVILGPQRPFPVGGKGDWTTINLSRGPSTVVSTTDAAINWGTGGALLNNGNPLAITATDGVVVPNTNYYSGFTFSPQLGDRPDGFIEAKTRTNVPLPGVGK